MTEEEFLKVRHESKRWEKRAKQWRAAVLNLEADLNSGKVGKALERLQKLRVQIESDPELNATPKLEHHN